MVGSYARPHGCSPAAFPISKNASGHLRSPCNSNEKQLGKTRAAFPYRNCIGTLASRPGAPIAMPLTAKFFTSIHHTRPHGCSPGALPTSKKVSTIPRLRCNSLKAVCKDAGGIKICRNGCLRGACAHSYDLSSTIHSIRYASNGQVLPLQFIRLHKHVGWWDYVHELVGVRLTTGVFAFGWPNLSDQFYLYLRKDVFSPVYQEL
jgi:hypothetical protein